MIELIEYELHLPGDRVGEKLAKTIGRILKHTYSAKRLRVQHAKGELIVTARVDRFNLPAIRGAVNMTMMARGVRGVLHRGNENGEANSGDEKRNSDERICATETAQISPK